MLHAMQHPCLQGECMRLFCGADKDDTPDINRGPSGRPDDPHMQVDQAADDHPAPKAG